MAEILQTEIGFGWFIEIRLFVDVILEAEIVLLVVNRLYTEIRLLAEVLQTKIGQHMAELL